jgi:hypothetical protein
MNDNSEHYSGDDSGFGSSGSIRIKKPNYMPSNKLYVLKSNYGTYIGVVESRNSKTALVEYIHQAKMFYSPDECYDFLVGLKLDTELWEILKLDFTIANIDNYFIDKEIILLEEKIKKLKNKRNN